MPVTYRKETLRAVAQAVTAGTDLPTVLGSAPLTGVVESVKFIPDTTLTGANTDSRSHNLVNKGSAGDLGTTEVAALDYTSGVNAAAYRAKALTLSAVEGALAVTKGDVLVLESVHVGSTGLADPGGTFEVVIKAN